MSARRDKTPAMAAKSGTTRIPLIGLDVSLALAEPRLRSWVPLGVVAIVCALLLASLRMDVIRMRFQVASSFKQELVLEAENRRLLVAMRELRDPARLSSQARALGFGRAAQMIDLDPAEPQQTPLPETPLYGPPLPDVRTPPQPADSPFEIASAQPGRAGPRP